MDPDEALKQMVGLAASLIATSEDETALRLADTVAELHGWLSKGGFFPQAWLTHPRENLGRGESRHGL